MAEPVTLYHPTLADVSVKVADAEAWLAQGWQTTHATDAVVEPVDEDAE